MVRLPNRQSVRMYSWHHKAEICCALNGSAFDGRKN